MFYLFLVYACIFMFVIKVFVVLFQLSGLSQQKSEYQVLAAITSTGLSTKDSQMQAFDDVRRKLSTALMIFGYFSTLLFIAMFVSLILSKYTVTQYFVLALFTVCFYIIINTKSTEIFVKSLVLKFGAKYIYGEEGNTIFTLYECGDKVIAEVNIKRLNPEYRDVPIGKIKDFRMYGLQVLSIKRNSANITSSIQENIIKPEDVLIVYGDIIKINYVFLTKTNNKSGVIELSKKAKKAKRKDAKANKKAKKEKPPKRARNDKNIKAEQANRNKPMPDAHSDIHRENANVGQSEVNYGINDFISQEDRQVERQEERYLEERYLEQSLANNFEEYNNLESNVNNSEMVNNNYYENGYGNNGEMRYINPLNEQQYSEQQYSEQYNEQSMAYQNNELDRNNIAYSASNNVRDEFFEEEFFEEEKPNIDDVYSTRKIRLQDIKDELKLSEKEAKHLDERFNIEVGTEVFSQANNNESSEEEFYEQLNSLKGEDNGRFDNIQYQYDGREDF